MVHGDTSLVFFAIPVAVAARGGFFGCLFFFGVAFHGRWYGYTSGLFVAVNGGGAVVVTRIFDHTHIAFATIDTFTQIVHVTHRLAGLVAGDVNSVFGEGGTISRGQTGQIGVVAVAIAGTSDRLTTLDGTATFVGASECGGGAFLAKDSDRRTFRLRLARKRIVGIDDDHATGKSGKTQSESGEA